MRVLVVDDEKIMLEAVSLILAKEADLEVETARSGREALEKAEIFHPELVMMDIKMPGISGLEALAELHRIDPQVLLVILTAYENFNFAQEAIQLSVLDYLVKPINKECLLETINKARKRLNQARHARQAELLLRERYKKLLPMIENELINALIKGIDPASCQEFQELLGTSFTSGFFMAFSYLNEPSLEHQLEHGYLLRQRLLEISETLRHLFPCFISSSHTNPILIFVPLNLEQFEDVAHENTFATKIINYFETLAPKIHFYLGVGRIYHTFLELKHSYREAMQALDACRFEQQLVFYNDLPAESSFNWEILIKDDILKIHEIVRFGQSDKVETFFNNFMQKYLTLEESHQDRLLFYLSELLIGSCLIAQENDVNFISLLSLRQFIGLFVDEKEMLTIFNEIMGQVLAITQAVRASRESHVNGLIARAKRIIETQFQEHLDLESLAKAVSASPYYLSRLFREELGINFSEYLTKLRLEKALELLARGFSVKEISISVGYNDPNYFSRIFRKYYGVSPSEYRVEGMN